MNVPSIPRQTLHCHTCYSDGGTKPAQLAAAAAGAGFKRIGISDHLVLHPTLGVVDWAMKTEWLDDYVDALRRAGDEAEIEVLVGLEVDFFPEDSWRRELDGLLRGRAIDYLVGSVHYVEGFNVDGNADDWVPLSPEEVAAVHRGYWERIAGAARCGGWAFFGHLDLPKKFGHLPEEPPEDAIAAALEAVAASGIPVELNTGGWDKPCGEAYPGPSLLERCREAGIKVLVNDDAHVPPHLGRHYGRAPAVLEAAGYLQVEELAPKRVRPLP